MFYMMPNRMADNALQSWIAAARDQATVQLITTVSMQKALQSRVVHDLESCALMVDEQADAVCLPVERNVARTCPSKRARKHGS